MIAIGMACTGVLGVDVTKMHVSTCAEMVGFEWVSLEYLVFGRCCAWLLALLGTAVKYLKSLELRGLTIFARSDWLLTPCGGSFSGLPCSPKLFRTISGGFGID